MRALLLLGMLVGAGLAGESVTIFAAASTTDVVGRLAATYGATHPVRIVTSFGGSAALAKQIEEGAPADIFLSADERWMDELARREAIRTASRVDLLGNSLVVVAPAARPIAIAVGPGTDIAHAFAGRLALGDPASVPAGRYAQQALTALGWWDALRDRLAPAADVRAALRLVELGEADLGIVYATDARAAPGVVVVATIPPALHDPIRYPIALTTGASEAAGAFLAWLRSAEADAVFVAAGFTRPPVAP